jgi:UDP-3-O-acyl-N-acetylglucosamine deacetylase
VHRPSVQHASVKIIDAVGDLALAGGPLLGTYRSVRGGHKLTHAVVCALMSDKNRLDLGSNQSVNGCGRREASGWSDGAGTFGETREGVSHD